MYLIINKTLNSHYNIKYSLKFASNNYRNGNVKQNLMILQKTTNYHRYNYWLLKYKNILHDVLSLILSHSF